MVGRGKGAETQRKKVRQGKRRGKVKGEGGNTIKNSDTVCCQPHDERRLAVHQSGSLSEGSSSPVIPFKNSGTGTEPAEHWQTETDMGRQKHGGDGRL